MERLWRVVVVVLVAVGVAGVFPVVTAGPAVAQVTVDPVGRVDLTECVNGQPQGACSPLWASWEGTVGPKVGASWEFYRKNDEVYVRNVSVNGTTNTGPICVASTNYLTGEREWAVWYNQIDTSDPVVMMQVSAGNDTAAQTKTSWTGAYAFRSSHPMTFEKCAATDPGAVVVPPGDQSIPPPDYKCGRTLRDGGNGQWFADLEAYDLYPANTGGVAGGDFVGYEDGSFSWDLSWSENDVGANIDSERTGVPSRNTVALPPLSQMPPGGWTATFFVIRTTDRNAGRSGDWSYMPDDGREVSGGGDFHDVDIDGSGPGGYRPIWVPGDVWKSWQGLPSDHRAPGHHFSPEMSLIASVNGAEVAMHHPDGWHVVYGRCSLTLDPTRPAVNYQGETGPATRPEHQPSTTTTSTTVAGGGSTGTTLRESGHDDQGEDGTKSDCSAGFLGRLPVIGTAFELVARLTCALKQLLRELFIPDDVGLMFDVGDYSHRFPASWVNEATDSVTTLQSSISTAAGGSACGPVMNLPRPMNMTVRFPGPAGCGPTAAGASAANDAESFNLYGYRGGIRAVLKLFLYLGVLWRLIRLTPWAEGKDDGAPSFDN